jgi:hypothetical protein
MRCAVIGQMGIGRKESCITIGSDRGAAAVAECPSSQIEVATSKAQADR